MAALEEDKPWWQDVRDAYGGMGDYVSEKAGQAKQFYDEMGSALDEPSPKPPPAQPATPAPAQPAQPAQPAPALDGEQVEQNPEIARKIALEESVPATQTASDADKEEMNKAIDEMTGGGLEDAYKQIIEKLGGEKVFDPKLERKDWGLFLMDFGMRMMAASNDPSAQLGGAIGTAGVGAMGALQERQTAEQGRVTDYNEQLRESALELAQTGRESKNVIWTDQGAYNMSTGKFMKGPEGGVLQPGMEPGAGNRQYAGQIGANAIAGSLEASGMGAEEAKSLGDRMSFGGAPDPGKYYTEVAAAFDRMQEKAGVLDTLRFQDGSEMEWGKAGPKEKDRYVREQVDMYMSFMSQGIGGPALQQPGPQAEGRSRPPGMDKYR